MNPTWEDPIPDDDDEENAYDKGFMHGREAVIFLIDASREMFEVQKEDSSFQLCLKCARTTLTNKIICSSKDLTAIVLFGTDKTKNNTDFKHIYVFQEFGEPGAERILETEELMSLDPHAFADKYGHSTDYSLADALWVCSIMFTKCIYTLAHKKILLFTCNDNPHEGNPQHQMQSRIKARDLHDSHVHIELLHIQRPNCVFNLTSFYKDMTCLSEDEADLLPAAAEKFDDLLVRVRSKDHKRRPVGSLLLTLGEGVEMGVELYKLVVPTGKPAAAKLWRDTNEEVTRVSKLFLGDTGEILLPSDVKKYQEYVGKRIYVSEDEVKQIRHFYEPGLLLMGFKQKACLKTHYHLKPSVFLYPDDRRVQGSRHLFRVLLQCCVRKGRLPICRLVARHNDPPRFVALLPQEEQKDERGAQTVPPGFHMVYLPFMEDIRSIKGETKHHPTDASVDKAIEIIKKLQFAYHPESFENPVLQKHWRNIEALALNRDAPEEIIDYTLPTKDVIEKRAGKLIEEFKMLLCPSSSTDKGIGDKQGMDSQCGSAVKRQRVEELCPMSLQVEAASGTLARYKVNSLKEFCKRNGIRCGTKKAEIIDAIKMFYQK